MMCQLLKKLKTIKRIKEADSQQLTEIVGTQKARIIMAHFHPEESND